MRQTLAVLTLLIPLFLTGCFGITQPTESSISEMASKHFNEQYAGLFSASKIEKINGYKQNDTHYVAELVITGKAQRSLDDYAKAMVQDESLSPLDKLTSTMTIGLLKMTLPQFSAGDEVTFEKNYLFIKTDNGWMLNKEIPANDAA